jgi:hypothetical protein
MSKRMRSFPLFIIVVSTFIIIAKILAEGLILS